MGWLFEDEVSAKGDEILDYVLEYGAFVPNLWHLEVTNVLVQAAKRNRIPANSIKARLNELSILPIKVDMLTHRKSFQNIADISIEYGISSYDASYVELAQRRDLKLSTKDKAMSKCAADMGLSLF